jgi:hypothetical protein
LVLPLLTELRLAWTVDFRFAWLQQRAQLLGVRGRGGGGGGGAPHRLRDRSRTARLDFLSHPPSSCLLRAAEQRCGLQRRAHRWPAQAASR